MKRLLFWSAILIPLGLAIFLTRQVYAQQPAPTSPSDDQVNTVARELYCPVCENIPLDVCPTTACAQWRATIREKLALGWSKQDIKDYFVRQYGARVLSEPPTEGLNWMVYILPPVLILLGAVLVVSLLRRMRRSAPPQQVGETGASASEEAEKDEYVRRLEEELRKRS